MAKLKAGSAISPSAFEDSLAAEMEAVMQSEWRAVKGQDLPSATGEQDRQIMFVAIARGLLKFLTEHRDDIETSPGDNGHRHTIEWEYE